MTFFDGGLPNSDKTFRMIMGGPEGKVVGERWPCCQPVLRPLGICITVLPGNMLLQAV